MKLTDGYRAGGIAEEPGRRGEGLDAVNSTDVGIEGGKGVRTTCIIRNWAATNLLPALWFVQSTSMLGRAEQGRCITGLCNPHAPAARGHCVGRRNIHPRWGCQLFCV